MEVPLVPMSWGELIDKITILEIKIDKIQDKAARAHVEKEHRMLKNIFDTGPTPRSHIKLLYTRLQKVNRKLWDIEDQIRDEERAKRFGETFIALARAVYLTNDERACIKREINLVLASGLVEEKSYAKYR